LIIEPQDGAGDVSRYFLLKKKRGFSCLPAAAFCEIGLIAKNRIDLSVLFSNFVLAKLFQA
jgi:hypothetical protein